MGLDSIEIVMKVEETFGIRIPDQEAEKIITVGDFHNCVWQHLELRNSEHCKSQAVFYKLRQAFIDTFNFQKEEIKTTFLTNELFPKKDRRQLYFEFENKVHLKMPDLVLTKKWATFLISLGLTLILGGLIFAIILDNSFGFNAWVYLIPACGILLTYTISNILNPQRVLINATSIRDFTKEVLLLNYSTIIKNSGTNRTEVELVISNIIADMSGLDLSEITSEKKIHDDLGID